MAPPRGTTRRMAVNCPTTRECAPRARHTPLAGSSSGRVVEAPTAKGAPPWPAGALGVIATAKERCRDGSWWGQPWHSHSSQERHPFHPHHRRASPSDISAAPYCGDSDITIRFSNTSRHHAGSRTPPADPAQATRTELPSSARFDGTRSPIRVPPAPPAPDEFDANRASAVSVDAVAPGRRRESPQLRPANQRSNRIA